MCQPTTTATTTRRRTGTQVTEEPPQRTQQQHQQNHNDDDVGYVLTRKVVSYHNLPNDAWVIHDGYVYDVTMFLEQHPGGAAILEQHLGEDVTSVMRGGAAGGKGAATAMTDNGSGGSGGHEHSAFAFKMLERYRIGRVEDAEAGSTVPDGNVDAATGKPLVRWDEPILPQVGQLGDKYHRWIHSFPTTDHTVKMFTNDTVEALTKCPWYVPVAVWVPVALAEFVHHAVLLGGFGAISWPVFTASFAVGFVCWLLFEYSLHRWVFHMRTTGYWMNIVHFLIHGHHHITPMDFDRLVFPPIPALLLGWPFWVGAPRLLGVRVGYPWLLGFVAGYLQYDMTHFWIHHAVPKLEFLKRQKRRHVHHHYFQPSVNFGISNPLFDHVFQTLKEPGH